MTIEEIKKWRKEGSSPHCMANEIIDTLLAEVATLEKHNAYAEQYTVVQYLHLTIAIEALERIEHTKWAAEKDLLQVIFLKDIASTALERIKE